jgi:hypothetical protein
VKYIYLRVYGKNIYVKFVNLGRYSGGWGGKGRGSHCQRYVP